MKVKLLVVQGRPAGKILTFAPGEYYLGRGDECHVRFNSDWVSRQHCLLRVTGELAVLQDLGSRNGTLVNGRRVSDCALHDGDLIVAGQTQLRFSVQAEAGGAASPSDRLPPATPPPGKRGSGCSVVGVALAAAARSPGVWAGRRLGGGAWR